MRSKSDLRPYQRADVDHILNHKAAMIWSDVGLGKTATALTAIEELMDRGEVYGTLVLAPLSVVRAVWRQEAKEWEHTKHLSFSLIHSLAKTAKETEAERLKAIDTRSSVYLLNYEGLPWFAEVMVKKYLKKGRRLPFNMVVYDESTKVKNKTSKRTRAICRLLRYVERRVVLTGTPATNGYMDLHGQYLCLDGGERLGANKTDYQAMYFQPGYVPHTWTIRKGAKEIIQRKIADITVQRKKKDYLDLPPVVYRDMWLDLPEAQREGYDELEKEFFLQLDGKEVEAFNAAALSNKCRQFANGACYVGDERREWAHAHDMKIEALRDIYKASKTPILVAYNFRHDLERIKKAFPKAVSVKDMPIEEIVKRWNAGKIDMLLGHPASMGHGLNLQFGGHTMVMFGCTWDLEHYQQVIGRLDRPGQKHPVIVIRLVMEDTIERAVVSAINSKAETQDKLREAIKQYRRTT